MKVLLVRPTLSARMYDKCEYPTFYEPLGLGYLAAMARNHGHCVAILDCLAEGRHSRVKDGELTRFGLDDEDTMRRVQAFGPDVVGIEFMFTGFGQDGLRVGRRIRAELPAVPILIGGADATARADELIREACIDLVVRGEGELTFVDILNRLDRDNDLPQDVSGTTSKTQVNPLREAIADISSLPFPARDLLPMNIYLEIQKATMPYVKRRPVGVMMSSRGCPYNCLFCSTTKVWRQWRPRTPENVVDEIELLCRDYGVREIAFQDDSFLVDPDRVARICAEIGRRNLAISWIVPPGLTVWTVTKEILETMAGSGFYRVCFPIECGTQEMLRYIRKPIKLDRVRELIQHCHKLGLWVYGNFMIGFPEEDAQSIEQTAQFAESCGLDMINCYVTQPYAGSDLYSEYERLGLLEGTHEAASSQWSTAIGTTRFSAEELRQKRADIYRRFSRRRIRRIFTLKGLRELMHKMNSPERFVYGIKVFKTFILNSLLSGRFAVLPEEDETYPAKQNRSGGGL